MFSLLQKYHKIFLFFLFSYGTQCDVGENLLNIPKNIHFISLCHLNKYKINRILYIMRYFLCISTVLFVRILFLMEIRIEKELLWFCFVLDLESNILSSQREHWINYVSSCLRLRVDIVLTETRSVTELFSLDVFGFSSSSLVVIVSLLLSL